jgi:hypothetical protein
VFSDVVLAVAAIGSVATAVGVWLAFQQLQHAKEHARTSFEDDLSRQYRSIMADLPLSAFFADDQGAEMVEGELATFYRYFDLCNEQLFLARHGRIRPETEVQWRDGIVGNLQLPRFAAAWLAISSRLPSNYLEDLRGL